MARTVAEPAVKEAPVPVMFVPTSAEGVPKAGVMSAGEMARTDSPVPVQVKRDEVATEVASAVEPVVFPRTLPAETCARFAKGRSPVTPVERGSPVALVRTKAEGVPSQDAPEMVNCVVDAFPKMLRPVHVLLLPRRVEEAAVMVMFAEPSKDVPLMVRAVAKTVAAPAVKLAPVPVMFVPTRAEGVPKAGVMSVGEMARTDSPVPVQVKRDVVATEVASAVEPVVFPRTLPAET